MILPSATRHEHQRFADRRLMEDFGILNVESLSQEPHRSTHQTVHIPIKQGALSQFRYRVSP
jgi:hypothetical protein